ncbi:transmembrane protein 268 isoform X2 [Takifugu rubripes]|uniref:Transmembrane protein 268 n=1 Tax=Takifugu rubripes TaxID=31033 RepID=A0A3B5KJL0_TAKRU|nr:transmembrane protein 268 isoform X2 [Takifugu rubripes]
MVEKGAATQVEERPVDVRTFRSSTLQPRSSSNTHNWANGQCVLALPSLSALNPRFDLTLCRERLENDGFQIPATDMEEPLTAALDAPAVRRYMVFNSSVFHFILAPVLYVVLWCALFSTLHLYMGATDYWVLCLCVSLVSIFITTAIIFILHHSNNDINMNLDVRLIQVNERLVKHKLLVGVADALETCTGNTQLCFVYWDMSRCLRTLTDAVEEHSSDVQNKLKRKMAHLILVSEGNAEAHVEPGWEEHRPLLRAEGEAGCRRPTGLGETPTNASLLPEASLPAQTKACQLLMTYSSVYVKLLVSRRLSGPSHHRLRPVRNHCTTAPFCLCQYIKKKILQ